MGSEIFKVKEGGFKEFKRTKFFLIIMPLLFFLLVFGFILTDVVYEHPGSIYALFSTVYTYACVFALFFYSPKRGIKSFESIEITIDGSRINRKQSDWIIEIYSYEITSITKDANGSFFICTSDQRIWVPAEMENSERMEQLLARIKPIKDQNIYIKIFYALSGLSVLGILTNFILSREILWIKSYTILLSIILLYALYLLRSRSDISRKGKSYAFWTVLIVIAFCAGNILYKLCQ